MLLAAAGWNGEVSVVFRTSPRSAEASNPGPPEPSARCCTRRSHRVAAPDHQPAAVLHELSEFLHEIGRQADQRIVPANGRGIEQVNDFLVVQILRAGFVGRNRFGFDVVISIFSLSLRHRGAD